MLNLNSVLQDIENHFRKEYPREGCGLLSIVKGRLIWTPCVNLSNEKDTFIISPKDFLREKARGIVVGVVHSHINISCTPSEYDIESCIQLQIPYYIFSYPDMSMYYLSPNSEYTSLFGREYVFGVQDCFEALRDYLYVQGIIIPLREPFEENWIEQGLDYFSESNINRWGYYKVTDGTVEKNDVLVFSVRGQTGDHCGVYIEKDTFYHHAYNRLSTVENLYPLWAKYLIGVYRREA